MAGWMTRALSRHLTVWSVNWQLSAQAESIMKHHLGGLCRNASFQIHHGILLVMGWSVELLSSTCLASSSQSVSTLIPSLWLWKNLIRWEESSPTAGNCPITTARGMRKALALAFHCVWPQYYTRIGLRYVCYLKIFDKNKRKSNLLGIKFQKHASPNFVSLALVGANVNASKHKQKYIYL